MQAQNYFYSTFLFPFSRISIKADENKFYNLEIFINNYETMMIVTFKHSQKVNSVLYLLYNCRLDSAWIFIVLFLPYSTSTINCVQNTKIA